MKIDEVIKRLKKVPIGNVQSNQEIIAEGLIVILEAMKKEKVKFT